MDTYTMEEYFSEWFYLISYEEAKERWEGNKSFCVLCTDGSDIDVGGFHSWEEIFEDYPQAMFGIEK